MKNIIYILLIIIPISFFSCEREFEYADGLDGLTFSVDTLMFDTIFSSIGSVTKNLKIYNPYDKDLIINSIELAGGDNSEFRINVNGYAESLVEDLKINALDSLYIFVDITIEPEDSNSPFVVNDSIIFTTGNVIQNVKLVAYGQDIVLIKQENIATTTFTNEKPYLIYDFLVVDSLETLTIEAGANLYFYDDAQLIVFGSMQVNGNYENPVKFLTYRLEEWYEDIPGQWEQIQFMPGSFDNILSYAEIKNSVSGIFVDSVGMGTESPLIIENCTFNHITNFGIIAQNSKIDVNNTIIGNCGYHSIALTLGGTYNFYHCTIANYWNSRSTAALFLNNYYTDDDGNQIINPLIEANFYNSIIYGSNTTELSFDFIETEDNEEYANNGYNYMFKDCLLKTDTIDVSDTNHYNSIIANEDPNLIDPDEYNYQLDTLSPCKDNGSFVIAYDFPVDILEISRINDNGPDIGAYERVENE